jgi:hypothetical protein
MQCETTTVTGSSFTGHTFSLIWLSIQRFITSMDTPAIPIWRLCRAHSPRRARARCRVRIHFIILPMRACPRRICCINLRLSIYTIFNHPCTLMTSNYFVSCLLNFLVAYKMPHLLCSKSKTLLCKLLAYVFVQSQSPWCYIPLINCQ